MSICVCPGIFYLNGLLSVSYPLITVHLALFFERAEVSLDFFEKTHSEGLPPPCGV